MTCHQVVYNNLISLFNTSIFLFVRNQYTYSSLLRQGKMVLIVHKYDFLLFCAGKQP